jgi:NADH-quinone oxidoreductase subunit C
MGIEPGSEVKTEIAIELLKANFPDGVLGAQFLQGDASVLIRPQFLIKAIDFLRKDPRLLFDVLIDITAVDFQGRKPRFDVVYHLLSLSSNQRLRAKVGVEENETVDSLTQFWGSANWLEREVWDMFGIRFSGHPDLRRILMYEEFEGHPLRKDYPIRKRQPRIGPKV